jgi:hypothetical protein
MSSSAPLLVRLLPLPALLLALSACGGGSDPASPGPDPINPDAPEDQTRARFGSVDESGIVVRRTGEGNRLHVRIPVAWEGSPPTEATLEIAIHGLDPASPAATARLTVRPTADGAVEGELDPGDAFTPPTGTAQAGPLGGWVLRWSIEVDRARVQGLRSLWEAWPRYDITLLSASELNIDGITRARILAADARTGAPLEDTEIVLSLRTGTGPDRELFRGTTDEFGVLSAPLDAEEGELGSGTLIAALAIAPGGEGPGESIEAAVRIVREQRVMITTDKPMYQPGQTIHVRTLTLSRPSLRPAGSRPVVFEVKDAAGNRVFRQQGTTDAYGVAALSIPLAQRLNMGNWTLSATVDGVTSERTVRVERYQLPDYGVTITPDRGYYRPGDRARIALDARYFFGRPVSGAEVTVEAWTFDVGFNQYATVTTTLSEEGLGEVEVDIPGFLVGQELNGGDAFVRLDFIVVDRAGQTEQITRNLVVSSQDVRVSVVPAGPAIPGADMPTYVLTRTPNGQPVATTCALRIAGQTLTFETDATGFAEVQVPVPTTEVVGMRVEARLPDGRTGSGEVTLEGASADDIAVYADQAVYAAGDSAQIDFLARGAQGRLFVDVIRDGQTLLTDAIDIAGGRASFTLDLSPELAGAIVVQGYYVTLDGRIVRGSRTLYVDAPGDLRIRYATDREEYRPGDTAEVTLQVQDAAGEGVQAAVGLTVVDEAVFALQDNQPGFERVYFQLEEALLSPAFNIYGFSIRDVVAGGELSALQRERAASVVLAGVQTPAWGIQLNTLTRAVPEALEASRRLGVPLQQRVIDVAKARLEPAVQGWEAWQTLQQDADRVERLVGQIEVIDPWGQRAEVVLERDGNWVRGIRLTSKGMDELAGTPDDAVFRIDWWTLMPDSVGDDGWGPPWAGGGGADAGGGWPGPVPEPDFGGDVDEDGGGGGGPRVRQFFPETLWVQPDIITDARGHYALSIPLADSITTWRMTGIASSANGQLGSATGGIRVFQPFFVDISVPLALTQGDEVEMPIAVFNYLEVPQTVELTLDVAASGTWFEPVGQTRRTLNLAPGEITSTSFRMVARDVGLHALQVTALGSEESDAVRRVVRVEPDGQPQPFSISDRLAASVTHTVTIPAQAIENATSLLVKIYPGLFGQLVEGLESLFRMPSGCFEQTSSTTYPNILALAYLRDTDQIAPELELQALQYIAQGYQALMSYEVPGGGFEWFGNAPAHRILTAYGLLEFHDMAQVFEVDPELIPRTQAWLVSQQESDGRFRAASDGIQEGATNAFTDSDVRATAYITYALAESGFTGGPLDQALNWLESNLSRVNDPYSLGMVANALLAAGRSTGARTQLEALLTSRQQETREDGTVLYWWGSESQSLYYGSGDAMNMETTALILQAFVRARFSPETVDGGVAWLVSRKDAFGNWESTQATILSLRLFIEVARNSTPEINGRVTVLLGDRTVGSVSISPANADLLHQFDLSDGVVRGDNEVTLVLEGESGLYYQIAGEYWLPWSEVEATPPESPLEVTVSYDRTTLEVDELVGVTARVTNRSGSRLDMVMLELGVPPGFDVLGSDLDALVADEGNGVARWERIGRRAVLYLYGIDAGATLEVSYRLRATLAVTVQTPATLAYLYYDASQRAESPPVELTVQ